MGVRHDPDYEDEPAVLLNGLRRASGGGHLFRLTLEDAARLIATVRGGDEAAEAGGGGGGLLLQV